jgi:REP element-mobilizing transposase RayT
MHNQNIQNRKAMRLKNYDYNQSGAYFITICIQQRECLLGNITNGMIQLNEYGEIVNKIWSELPNHFQSIDIDAAVIMPNHFHGIVINFDRNISTQNSTIYKQEPPLFYQKKTKLGKIIAYFKYQTTRLINQKRAMEGVKVWQRNYYDHIIRSQESLEILRKYIIENPLLWTTDQLHPHNPSKW